MGGPELLILLVVIVFAVGFLWGIIDCLQRPAWAFKAAGQNKWVWVIGMIVAWVIALGWLVGWIYVFAGRPKVAAAQHRVPPPPPPPPPDRTT
jgi:hypothetical protein